MKMGDILTAVSEIYQRSAGRGLGQKQGLIPENGKRKDLHPCPPFFLSAVFLVRRVCGGVEGLNPGADCRGSGDKQRQAKSNC